MSPPIVPEEELPVTSELAPPQRLALTVIWCSFLSASVATMVFFAFVDPLPIVAALMHNAAVSDRMALYSGGFLIFWVVCALASSLTAWLVSTPPNLHP